MSDPRIVSGLPCAPPEDYDNEFLRAMFGGSVDAQMIVDAMSLLVINQQAESFMIVTVYLDLAYVNGAEPRPAEISRMLQSGGDQLAEDQVRTALMEFFELLNE